MCGIAGILDRSGAPVGAGEVEAMIRAIRHRGPDDVGLHCRDGFGLGAARLSIIDLTPAGHMPMVDEETGNWIVHNGEVYNYQDVRRELDLKNLKSRTDTEVILKAYGRLGPRCVDRFNGIFAFAIWDARRQLLFCARDRLGVKPFFYSWNGRRFVFASEAKSLFQAGVLCRPELAVIRDYLVHGIYDHDARTFFEGVQQLPPSHTLSVGAERFELTRYWDVPGRLEAEVPSAPDEDGFAGACRAYGELAEDAVRLQLRSDTPVAVHVSGGLDSTFLMALINKINGGQGRFKAFCRVYGEPKYDERPHVERLVREIGWNAEYHDLDAREVPALAEEAMWQQEMPFPGIITLGKHKLIKSTRPHGAKVILEGQGGDEIGAGYQYYMGPHLLDVVEDGRVDEALREIRAFAAVNGTDEREALRKALGGIAAYRRAGRSADGTRAVRPDCLAGGLVGNRDEAPEFPEPFRSHLLNMQYRDILHTKLPRILRSSDRASMGYGRELRVPFLDHRLVEFSFALPASFKIAGGIQRRFMRECLKALLPTPLADLPKRAVVNPQTEWLQGPLRDWVGDLISSRSFRERGMFAREHVARAFGEFTSRDKNENSFFVWQWVSMELWFRAFIDRAPVASAVRADAHAPAGAA
jgi:asparagine synthase (glutamine-hydrolysing)